MPAEARGGEERQQKRRRCQAVSIEVPSRCTIMGPEGLCARANVHENLLAGNRHPRLRTTDVPAMDRRWRDQKQALMSVCCDLGCQMSDLFMLC